MMTRVLGFTTGLLVALAGGYLAHRHVSNRTLPTLETAPAKTRARGAFHVHSRLSHDSELSLEAIAAAANHNQLDFVVVTDHNHQHPQPVIIGGVTVVPAAELTTPLGHIIGLGTPMALAAEARSQLHVAAAIRKEGGTPVIAHPSDRKAPWTGSLQDIGGIEIANNAAATRRKAGPIFLGLLPVAAAWHTNPTLALSQLIDRDTKALARWDETRDPAIAGYCGADTHGWIPPTLDLQSWNVILHEPIPTDATSPEKRAVFILTKLKNAQFDCVTGLLGRTPNFAFYAADQGGTRRSAGTTLSRDKASRLVVQAPKTGAETRHIVLLRNGDEVARTQDDVLHYERPTPGTYRAELRLSLPQLMLGFRVVPVLYSNRIRIADPETSE